MKNLSETLKTIVAKINSLPIFIKIGIIAVCLILVISNIRMNYGESTLRKIQLTIAEQDYYQDEEITVDIQTNNMYTLTEDDFVMLGGEVKVKDRDTAILTFPSTGTFHVYAKVGDVQSNELTIRVVATNAIANRIPEEEKEDTKKTDKEETETEEENTNTETEITANEVIAKASIPSTTKDLSDVMTLYSADASELVDSDRLAANRSSYVGYSFAFEGSMPDNGDSSYILSASGQKIPLVNGQTIGRIGQTRVYGTMQDEGFFVELYTIVE